MNKAYCLLMIDTAIHAIDTLCTWEVHREVHELLEQALAILNIARDKINLMKVGG